MLKRMLHRRQLLALTATSLVGASSARALAARALAAQPYEIRELQVPGDKRLGTRFNLLIPRHTDPAKVPLLVLLHGLGETHDQGLGIMAWLERYGLLRAYQRLLTPPLERLYPKRKYWRPERLLELNRTLEAQPFRGLAIACPFTPNVYRAPAGRKATLDGYADWLVEEVIPRARRESGALPGASHTYLDGCSLGGYVGLEVFLRKPTHFGAWGSVQGALGAHRVAAYAKRIADVIKTHGPRHIHVETSTGDAFRKVNETFIAHLKKHGVTHQSIVPPGPHNQPFLRDSGTIEMLSWHDRLPR